ncbi:MAG: hypothetical protein IT305_32940 [Chloroflexi bacterium]|nr:hypothetical protein [Chloroflexota bacterium]
MTVLHSYAGWAARIGGLLAAIALFIASSACMSTHTASDSRSDADAVTPTALHPAPDIPEDVQRLTIEIRNGKLQSDRYTMQPGPTRLIVKNDDEKVYTLAIQGLVDPQQIAMDQTTQIGLTAPDTGMFQMTLGGAASDTAILDVHPVGG